MAYYLVYFHMLASQEVLVVQELVGQRLEGYRASAAHLMVDKIEG